MHTKKHYLLTLAALFATYNFFVFSFLFSEPLSQQETNRQLKINIIGLKNGKGLETDINILLKALVTLDCHVTFVDFKEERWNKAHINIFIQGLSPEKFFWAKQNWFIPNPEWYDSPLSFLDKIDLVLCRTKEVEKIFKNLNTPTYYIGFTSPDCYQEDIQKNFHYLCHLAGGSDLKGTQTIKNLWLTAPSFPDLTVVHFTSPFLSNQTNLKWISNRLPEDKFRRLQNKCGIHLCPSEVEGFGHYLQEAMSTGAVVVTTDAPPMNEFITDPRCLVPPIKEVPLKLATCYEIDPEQLRLTIESLIKLPIEELQTIGEYNREIYLANQQIFYERLEELVLLADPLREINIDY